MIKKALLLLSLLLTSITLTAQEAEEIYDHTLNGMVQIDEALQLANTSDKHVFIQLGGNWCPWCIRFHHFVNDDKELKTFVDDNYVVVRLNYSRDNMNTESLTYLDFPQRFGYPVFVILDKTGKRIHTQNSALLEEDNSYNRKKVFAFFKHWTATAVNPESYKK